MATDTQPADASIADVAAEEAEVQQLLPLLGYEPALEPIGVVETLTDEQLTELNGLLPWSCFITDGSGRRFGQPAAPTKFGKPKRSVPMRVPDKRVTLADARFGLKDLTVLEIGCFEGIHTADLARRARHVKACDSRIVNLAKTAVRCAMYQINATVFLWDVEQPLPRGQDASCDILFHVGVLYHLVDPIGHLRRIAPQVRRGVILDTHYAADNKATDTYVVNGDTFRCRQMDEGGVANVFSGMYQNARWLKLDDLVKVLADLGFGKVEVMTREERHGPRVLILAEREIS